MEPNMLSLPWRRQRRYRCDSDLYGTRRSGWSAHDEDRGRSYAGSGRGQLCHLRHAPRGHCPRRRRTRDRTCRRPTRTRPPGRDGESRPLIPGTTGDALQHGVPQSPHRARFCVHYSKIRGILEMRRHGVHVQRNTSPLGGTEGGGPSGGNTFLRLAPRANARREWHRGDAYANDWLIPSSFEYLHVPLSHVVQLRDCDM